MAGFEKVRAWLCAGKAGLLVAAADGADGGRAKLRALAPGVAVLDGFSAAQLGAALGRETAGHVAVAPGTLGRAPGAGGGGASGRSAKPTMINRKLAGEAEYDERNQGRNQGKRRQDAA